VTGFFEIGSHDLFAQGWLQTAIVLILASCVARITGVSYQHLVSTEVLLKSQQVCLIVLFKTT
jgi:hypothetical protein